MRLPVNLFPHTTPLGKAMRSSSFYINRKQECLDVVRPCSPGPLTARPSHIPPVSSSVLTKGETTT
jgi:hypothetical protein